MTCHNVDEKRSSLIILQSFGYMCICIFAFFESEIMNFEDIIWLNIVLFCEPCSCFITICLSFWYLGIGLIEYHSEIIYTKLVRKEAL